MCAIKTAAAVCLHINPRRHYALNSSWRKQSQSVERSHYKTTKKIKMFRKYLQNRQSKYSETVWHFGDCWCNPFHIWWLPVAWAFAIVNGFGQRRICSSFPLLLNRNWNLSGLIAVIPVKNPYDFLWLIAHITSSFSNLHLATGSDVYNELRRACEL